MPTPLPEPAPPPSSPPLSLWPSLGILGLGLALAVFLAVVYWRSRNRTAADEEDDTTDDLDDAEPETEHSDQRVV